MQISGFNIHGGKNNSDIIIHASGEGFNELIMFCEAVLKTYAKEDYRKGSTTDRVLQIAKELPQMMHPVNSSPKRLFTTT